MNIEGGGMMGIPGFAARTFSALAREGIALTLIGDWPGLPTAAPASSG